MTLYLFDYNGTLNTLSDPTGFLRDLRVVDPGCQIVLVTGSEPEDIDKAVLAAVDEFWAKPCFYPDMVKGTPNRLVYADDEALMRRATARMFRSADFEVDVIAPEGLQGLLAG